MPLRSGQPVTGQWRFINRQELRGNFHKGEIIAGRDAVETRRPRTLIGGGSTSGIFSFALWSNQAITAGTLIRVSTTATIGNVTTTPGTYICVANAPGGASGLTNPGDPGYNQIPQYPEPASGTVYFYLIALGPQQFGGCSSTGAVTEYVNASAPI